MMAMEKAKFAGFWVRLAAMLADFVIIALLTGAVLGPVAYFQAPELRFGFGLDCKSDNPELNPEHLEYCREEVKPYFALLQLVGGVASNLIDIVYFVGFWAWRAQTPGKMLLGLRIVRSDGTRIGLGTAILRYIGQIVSAVLVFIGFLMIAWDREKQGLHDKIANTHVVRIR